MKKINIYIALFIVFLTISCNESNVNENLNEPQETEELVEENSIPIQHKDTSIFVVGIIEAPPQNLISISIPVGGFVKKTTILEGQKVKKGAFLFSLEHQDYIKMQQEYLQLKNELNYVEKDYLRQKKLNEEQVNAQKTFQKIEFEYNDTKIKLKALESQLKMISINPSTISENSISNTISVFAPVNGYISKVNLNVGKYVPSEMELVNLVNLEHLHAELIVYENDISKIKIGQKINLYLNNSKSEFIGATVYLISRTISENRTIKIHAYLDKESDELYPGMFVNAEIFTN